MSLASIIGIILNIIIKSDADEKEIILVETNKYNKIKKEIKDEVLLELKEELKKMKFIKVDKNKENKKNKKANK